MKELEELLQRTWEAKPQAALDGEYVPGANLRAEAAVRHLAGGVRLLDLGCGAGTLALLLHGRYREVHGIDLSARAVDAAKRRGVQARVGDLNARLPYDDGMFDAVTNLSVLQYVFDPAALMLEIRRVLAPGGRALIGFPNMRTLIRVGRLLMGRFPRVSQDPGYDGGTIHYFCRRNVEELVAQSGMTIENSVGVFTRPRFLEAVADGVPVLGALKREWLSAEIMVLARR
ncbi:MAG: class I SAM-dependent methyltransferase [Gemmatimonadetes bacterium]|nr:class I SAM-dependent methyltransferase [Gemmatimonadota bacterium]